MEKLENIFEKIKENETFKITSFAEMDINNKHFIDYEYFTIEKDNIFFYIQKAYFGIFEVTAYEKINWNKKQQITYPREFTNLKELNEIINDIIFTRHPLNALSKTTVQRIYLDLDRYEHFNGKYLTILGHLKNIAGYREQEILKNIDSVEMKLNNKYYKVLEFYNKDGQSFAINTKNIQRLIVS